MIKVIWLDDIREPQDFLYKSYTKDEIVVCKNYTQFINLINRNGLPELICFDHDLGAKKTGYDCAKWLVNYCRERKIKCPNWYIQSANIVGKININNRLNDYNIWFEQLTKD